MANERYDQFPPGSYDTAKIFLQAHATTGALEKVNLPLPGVYPGTGTPFSAYTTGDILFASATNVLSKLSIGTTGQILSVVSGAPAWAAPPDGLPSQTGNSGKFLTTNGSSASWAATTAGPISGLSVATATNTINNANYLQEWQWNSLTAGNSGLRLSANTTGSTGLRLLEILLSGANSSSAQTTYGSYTANTKTGTGSTNVGAFFAASGGAIANYAIQTDASGFSMYRNSSTTILALKCFIESNQTVFETTNGKISFRTKWNGSAGTDSLTIDSAGIVTIAYCPLNLTPTIPGTGYVTAMNILAGSGGVSRLQFGLDSAQQAMIIMGNSSLRFYNTQQAGDFMRIWSTTGNVQIQNVGTYTDIASARLAVNSTDQGVLLPRMTTTQKAAITTPATGLIVYDTTLNKLAVFTGAVWEAITST